MSDLVDVKTRLGRMIVHRHWLDSVAVIVERYERRRRRKGSWNWTRDGWAFVMYEDEL